MSCVVIILIRKGESKYLNGCTTCEPVSVAELRVADDGTRWRREEGYAPDRITDIPIFEWLPRFFPKFENSRSLLPHIKRDGAFHNVPLIRCSHGRAARGDSDVVMARGFLGSGVKYVGKWCTKH
jgi:hypothetical protein